MIEGIDSLQLALHSLLQYLTWSSSC